MHERDPGGDGVAGTEVSTTSEGDVVGDVSSGIHHAPDVASSRRFGITLLVCVAAWLIPGAGHAVLRRWRRAAVFMVLVTTVFAAGLMLDGKVYRIVEGEPLSYLAAFGGSGVGAYFLAAHASGAADGDLFAPYHEYGNTFTLVAGLLNLLVLLDAYDLAGQRRAHRAAVHEPEPDSESAA